MIDEKEHRKIYTCKCSTKYFKLFYYTFICINIWRKTLPCNSKIIGKMPSEMDIIINLLEQILVKYFSTHVWPKINWILKLSLPFQRMYLILNRKQTSLPNRSINYCKITSLHLFQGRLL